MSATVTLEKRPQPPALPAVARGRLRRIVDGVSWRYLCPTLFTAVNAVAFFLLRPNVNDLSAARARASAVAHGVGLTYWFSWFGGGSTPGNYSVLTPSISSVIGTELVGSLAAVLVAVLGTVALRGTRFPLAAAWVVGVAASINLWSGRVPFLLSGAIAIGALICLRHGRRLATLALTLLSILASPVAATFLAMGLSGTFLTTRTRAWRPAIALTAGAAVVGLLAVAVLFGTPGPEPYSGPLASETLGGLILLWFAKPQDHIRTTVAWSFPALVVLYSVPNGMGSNFARFVWFCLPVMVVATTRRRLWVCLTLVVPVLVAGLAGTITDLRNAARPVSSVGYYTPLSKQLDTIAGLDNYRVEVVNHGAHAAYDALLGHVMLARGWETQEDQELNGSLAKPVLDSVTYKVWLDNNAVGYVALPAATVGEYSEYDLVDKQLPGYLHLVWQTKDWRLFRVQDPTPIVARPATIGAHSQSALTLSVPCICTVNVRVRWSKFLVATTTVAKRPATASHGTATRTGPVDTEVSAEVRDDGSHWTTVTTSQPGTYVLRGSLSGFLR